MPFDNAFHPVRSDLARIDLSEPGGGSYSRRQALALVLGTSTWLATSCGLPARGSADDGAPVRIGISESLVQDVNINDARAAMAIWLKRCSEDLNTNIKVSPKIFETGEELVRLARNGQLDSVALNIIEYRQIAEVMDSSQILCESGSTAPEQYVLLVKRNGRIQQLGDLRGCPLLVSKAPKMCAAPDWLSTLLDERRLGPSDLFFGSFVTDSKPSRVILPVFFGQADACLTSKRSFETMGELNPQVLRDLTAIASSVPMLACFSVFHKAYNGVRRDRFAKVYGNLRNSAAGRQVGMLFHFEDLAVRDSSCLAPALAMLEAADRIRTHHSAGSKRG